MTPTIAGLICIGTFIDAPTHEALRVRTNHICVVDSKGRIASLQPLPDGAVAEQANAEQLKAYDDLVASTALPAQQVGDVKKDDLPGVEALSRPGNKPGEVKMVRNGELVEAHQVRNVE